MSLDLTGLAVDNRTLSEMNAEIGSIRTTMKDPALFSNETLGTWYLMDGRSCAGTQYETDFGASNVPDMYTEGTFLRQAKPGRTVGTYESDELKSHEHTIGVTGADDNNHSGNGDYVADSDASYKGTRTTNHTGGSETRPKNIAVNYMIKVDH